MPAAKPVVREDGKAYISATAAAQAMGEEMDIKNPQSLAASITRCCNHKPGYKTAYGYAWEWAESARQR